MYRNIHFRSFLRRITALSVLCGFCGSTGDNSMWYSMWFSCGCVWFSNFIPYFSLILQFRPHFPTMQKNHYVLDHSHVSKL